MFRKSFILLLGVAVLAACSDKDDNAADDAFISGSITIDKQYGTPVPNFTANDMISKGFSYGDMLTVRIGNTKDLVVPFVTAYTQAGIMGLSCCDYGATGGVLNIGIANGNFHDRVGGNDGDTIIISMNEKGGYLEEYKLLQASYDNIRNHYPSDAAFANFREVTTTGMGVGKLYRGSNPLNAKNNPVRYAYMDDFARQVGIQTEIDLADDDDMIAEQLATRQDTFSYCPTLFRNGQVVAVKMSADTFNDDFKARLARAYRFIIAHEPPYLIHCNEGKDRCGFVTLLLEALMGADVIEIEEDYMTTFENYYLYEYHSDGWILNQKLNVDRMLRLMMYPSLLDDITTINWDLMLDATPTMLYTKTVEFLKSAGLTDSEIEQLKEKLR